MELLTTGIEMPSGRLKTNCLTDKVSIAFPNSLPGGLLRYQLERSNGREPIGFAFSGPITDFSPNETRHFIIAKWVRSPLLDIDIAGTGLHKRITVSTDSNCLVKSELDLRAIEQCISHPEYMMYFRKSGRMIVARVEVLGLSQVYEKEFRTSVGDSLPAFLTHIVNTVFNRKSYQQHNEDIVYVGADLPSKEATILMGMLLAYRMVFQPLDF